MYRIVIKEALFYGLSITAFFVMMASVLTYIPHMFLYTLCFPSIIGIFLVCV